VAPAVSWQPDGWWVAIGGIGRVVLVKVTHAGVNQGIIRSFPDGFGFPALSGDWIGYKGNESTNWTARLWNLATGQAWTFQQAGGNYPIVLGSNYFAWQLPVGYSIYRVPLANPGNEPAWVGSGAPDGLAWIDDNGEVALVKNVRFSVPGMLNPQSAATVTVGEQPDIVQNNWPLGMAVKVGDTTTRGWLLGAEECVMPHVACSPDGQHFAIVTSGAEGVRLVLATLQELADLPKPPSSPTVPPIEPPIPPVIPPQPGVPMKLPAHVFATLQQVRAKYPTPLGNQGAAVLNETAWVHRVEGYALHSKPGGNNCPQPRTGASCSCDFLRLGDLGFDVLSDSEGAGTPVQADSQPASGPIVPPVDPGVVTVPPIEPPTQPPTQPPSSDHEARIAALEQRMAALEASALKSGDKVALRTDNAHYYCAEGGGGGDVNATRTTPGGWETVTLEKR
jgi:hypothetical protein